jgi:predicted TPR repeat methyltransferase
VESLASTAPSPLISALEHYRAGRLEDAERDCRRALATSPGDPDALHMLGRVLLQRGREAFAVPVLEQAAAARPGDPAVLVRLGRALYGAGESEAALGAYERALEIDHADGKARMHRGIALLDLGRPGAAEQELRTAAGRDPERAERHFYLANALVELGREDEARRSFAAALLLEGRYRRAHARLGIELTHAGQLERARRMFAWGLAINPDDAELTHMVAASNGRAAPPRASDEYVTTLFDRFADVFDERLVGELGYRTPALIAEAAARHLPGGRVDILDAGCGTGLCGPLLRPFARRLVGVDLSPGMLERASARGTYDELRAEEITRAMAAEPSSYDLVVAADVLVYFGDLTELFRAMAVALRPGGIGAASVEREDGPGYALRPSGRYAHNPGYVREAAAGAGLEEVEGRPCELRLEAGRPVAGWIAVVQRADRAE